MLVPLRYSTARFLVLQVARTVKGRDKFPFRITIVPVDRPVPRPPWVGTSQWRDRAIYNIKMKLSIQVKKASIRAGEKWYKFYSVRGYGAPGRLEFICPYSGMTAKTINQEEAASVRRYWSVCAKKTQEVLDWLNDLDPKRYTADLNTFLLRLIVITYGMREIEEYQKSNPYSGGEKCRKG